jgi:hypothetical protein
VSVETEEKGSSAVALLLIYLGGGAFAAAVGFLNSRWGWVVLAAGMVLIGLTMAANNRTVEGSVFSMRIDFESWSAWTSRLNTIGCVLAVVGVLMIWTQ